MTEYELVREYFTAFYRSIPEDECTLEDVSNVIKKSIIELTERGYPQIHRLAEEISTPEKLRVFIDNHKDEVLQDSDEWILGLSRSRDSMLLIKDYAYPVLLATEADKIDELTNYISGGM